MKKANVLWLTIGMLILMPLLGACGRPDHVLEPESKSTTSAPPSSAVSLQTSSPKTTGMDKEIRRGPCYLGIKNCPNETLVHVAYYDQFTDERYRKNYGTVRFEDEGKFAEVALVMKAEGSSELIEGPQLCVRVDFENESIKEKHNLDYTDKQGKLYALEMDDDEIFRVISQLRDEVQAALKKS